jgi:serine/threonine protein kinase
LIGDTGLAQLADFGVSSSLTSDLCDRDRSNVRRTFVGTPCWMAPEVMEQSAYNCKADIWSFGITALELAYGKAPYAKYPPLKVIMLTLRNEPPTLERNQTKHKYSKSFKEMIDLCLLKDPDKRPTPEKLLNHSFFKNAKNPEILLQSILKHLPPITERMKTPHPSEPSPEQFSHASWDFDISSRTSDMSPIDRNNSPRTEILAVRGRFTVNPARELSSASRFSSKSREDSLDSTSSNMKENQPPPIPQTKIQDTSRRKKSALEIIFDPISKEYK